MSKADRKPRPSPNLIWVAIVYILGLAVGIGLVGRITDITGRRWFMIVGNLFGVSHTSSTTKLFIE